MINPAGVIRRMTADYHNGRVFHVQEENNGDSATMPSTVSDTTVPVSELSLDLSVSRPNRVSTPFDGAITSASALLFDNNYDTAAVLVATVVDSMTTSSCGIAGVARPVAEIQPVAAEPIVPIRSELNNGLNMAMVQPEQRNINNVQLDGIDIDDLDFPDLDISDFPEMGPNYSFDDLFADLRGFVGDNIFD